MFSSNIPTSSFSFSGIISGLSKALNTADRVIPLYQKAQPLFKNIRSAFDVIKTISITDKKEENTTKPAESNQKLQTNSISNNKNTPNFFQ